MNSRMGPSAFIDSSMKGATSTATSASGSPHCPNSLLDNVFTSSATAGATQAPQPNAPTRNFIGSGSYRSSHRKLYTSTGTGRIAATMPMVSATGPMRQPTYASTASPQTAKNVMTPLSSRIRGQSKRRGVGGAAASAM